VVVETTVIIENAIRSTARQSCPGDKAQHQGLHQ
jgi:hypothetical protein